MDENDAASDSLLQLAPKLALMGLFALLAAGALALLDRWLRRREQADKLSGFQRHLWMLAATLVGVSLVALASPDPALGLQFVAVLASVVLTLSSSTLVSNGLAGLMIQAQRHFRTGDYLRVADHFGRVSDRGLFFTELENDVADLVTLPNSFLISEAVTVIRRSGTLISAEVSLGYDVPRQKVEAMLRQAAETAGLKMDRCFVHVLALGDFSVQYRLSAQLEDVKRLLTKQSELKEAVLDTLHGAGIEIASPTIMLQRPLPAQEPLIPHEDATPVSDAEPEIDEEKLMFPKALEGETIEKLTDRLKAKTAEIEDLKQERGEAAPERETEIGAQIGRLEQHCKLLENKIGELQEKAKEDD